VVFAAAHAGFTYRSLLLVMISVKQGVVECLEAKQGCIGSGKAYFKNSSSSGRGCTCFIIFCKGSQLNVTIGQVMIGGRFLLLF